MPPLSSSDLFGCLWHWRTRLPDRKGQRCRVLVRGGMNSVLVEFTNGQKVVTSRYAIRKLPNDYHQRWEPAAESSQIVADVNGWLPSAAWCG